MGAQPFAIAGRITFT